MVTARQYLDDVVAKGDEGSDLLRAICSETLVDPQTGKNRKYVDIISHGEGDNKVVIPVLRLPREYLVVVHSAVGAHTNDVGDHAAWLVDRLVEGAKNIGAVPVGFADVVDSYSGDTEMLSKIGNSLVDKANEYGLVILNGENAILGDRVNPDIQANVSGTMISIMNKNSLFTERANIGVKGNTRIEEGLPFEISGTSYAVFDHGGDAVFINSDGIGTKTEFYERTGEHFKGLLDSLAMKLDDTIKLGARAKAVSDVVETRGDIDFLMMEEAASVFFKKTGITYILQRERSENRIRGYSDNAPSYNVSGSVVSTIDEQRLMNPPMPREGDSLIAIRGRPNPRSNGITGRRKAMVDMFGENYHKTDIGAEFLEYLAEPSTVFYPLFMDLLDQGIASSVYHMSGGAYNGKLAKPLAKQGLFVRMSNLFTPDWRDFVFMGHSGATVNEAYGTWPMGNEGFITTDGPARAMDEITRRGYDAREAGRIKRTPSQTGVEIETYTGKSIRFSGKD